MAERQETIVPSVSMRKRSAKRKAKLSRRKQSYNYQRPKQVADHQVDVSEKSIINERLLYQFDGKDSLTRHKQKVFQLAQK